MIREVAGSNYVATVHQIALQLGPAEWTIENLVAWLDRHIDHQDIPVGESAATFLGKAIKGLMAKFGIDDVSMLALDLYRLSDEIEARIQQHRFIERKAAFQRYLLPDSPLEVKEERSLNFSTIRYEPSWNYKGSYQFKKHYFPPKPRINGVYQFNSDNYVADDQQNLIIIGQNRHINIIFRL